MGDGVRVPRLVGVTAPPSARTVAALAIVSFLAAIVVARVAGSAGPWLWNLDLPKIHYPLATFFHDALAGGGLPLWNDELGLGFPLYAEGQIGAFYPPNWLIFQLPPLVALDVTRVLHLTIAGLGAGLIVLRVAGSRSGAAVAAIVAVMGGAIASKLEWHNLIAAYAFMPWVLLPLVRRPSPTRGGLVTAGILFGIQAWTGHPNTWLLTGLAAGVILFATTPRLRTIGRIAGLGLLGGSIGAVQLLPTAILTSLSVRSQALSANDLFTSAATPFDILSFAFGNAFVRTTGNAWDPATTWYPDGSFALLEAAAYVGLPVLALAAVGIRTRRARPFVALIAVCLAIPIVAALRPEPWMEVPILNGLRSPVRSYVVVSLGLAVLAGIGVGRLGRSPGSLARAGVAVAVPVAAYALAVGLATVAPAIFDRLLLDASTFLGPAEVENRRMLAIDALGAPWPLAPELVGGAAILLVVARAGGGHLGRRRLVSIALIVAAAPLVLLGPSPNGVRPENGFSFARSDYVRTLIAAEPHRLFAYSPPGWFAGMPDQLAAAGVPDLRMFSSLDLLASDRLIRDLEREDPDGRLRRVVGVDTVVTFGEPCPGQPIAAVEGERASICRDDAALRPPYWLPYSAVLGAVSAIDRQDVRIEYDVALATAVAQPPASRTESELTVEVNAPARGWLWIDRAWWPAWRTTVDGVDVAAARAVGGQLVPVSAGTSVVRQVLVPWDALLGLASGAVAFAIAVAWVRRGRRSDADRTARLVSPSALRRS